MHYEINEEVVEKVVKRKTATVKKKTGLANKNTAKEVKNLWRLSILFAEYGTVEEGDAYYQIRSS